MRVAAFVRDRSRLELDDGLARGHPLEVVEGDARDADATARP
jgi:hypothetical protein